MTDPTLTRNIAQMVTEVADHIAQDRVIQGIYYAECGNSFKGCFIGCLSHSKDASKAVDRFGLTLPLLRIAENIFEALPEAEAKKFFADFAPAVCVDGKDLSNVHWQFLAAELKTLPRVSAKAQIAIDAVIDGMDRLAQGLAWLPARAAADAARVATYAAAYAAADAACRKRQRDTLLDLIRNAPVVEVSPND